MNTLGDSPERRAPRLIFAETGARSSQPGLERTGQRGGRRQIHAQNTPLWLDQHERRVDRVGDRTPFAGRSFNHGVFI